MRSNFNALVTSLGVIIGVFVTIYNLQSTKEDQLNQQATTLFVESIKLLGNKDADASSRAGAVYAIQRVMERDSDFHNAAVNTLVAFIRAHRSRNAVHCGDTNHSDGAAIEAAFQVIGHRSKWIETERQHVLNFSFLCLFGTDFNNLDLAGADFQHSDLRRTSFENADVSGALFTAASFDYWRVPGVDPHELTIEGFKNVVATYRRYEVLSLFTNATVVNAHFEGACLRGVDFMGARLRGANFDGSGISFAYFEGATDIDEAQSFSNTCSAYPPLGLTTITGAFCGAPRRESGVDINDQCEVENFTQITGRQGVR